MLHRRDFLAGSLAALGCAAFPRGWVQAADTPRRKVLFFTRSAGFQHSVIHRKPGFMGHAENLLTEVGAKHGFDVTATKDGGVFDGDLAQYDAIAFYTTGDLTNEKAADGSPAMSKEGKQKLLDTISGGKGFVGFHCASDTFHTKGEARQRQAEPDPYIAMLGGEFISHGAQQAAKMRVVSAKFPGLADVGEGFDLNEEWYSLKNFAEDMHVILVQETEGMKGGDYERPIYPATWARKHGSGRVFYTSMGHREDVWTNPTFQQIMLGGLSWACGNVEADVTPNFASVTPDGQVMPGERKG